MISHAGDRFEYGSRMANALLKGLLFVSGVSFVILALTELLPNPYPWVYFIWPPFAVWWWWSIYKKER